MSNYRFERNFETSQRKLERREIEMARCTTTAIHSNGKSNGHGAIHEEIFSENSGDSQELLFDTIVGHLQDLVIEDQFTEIQQSFMDKHYRHFENVDENKLIYTDIHKQYIELIEAYIERKLLEKCPQFNMESFSKMLESRRLEIPDEIFEMFLSFTDFLAFKQMFLDYKAEKEGLIPDLSGLITSSSLTK